MEKQTNKNEYEMALLENMHLAEEAISVDYGFDSNNAIWKSINKVIYDAGKDVNVVYAKLVDEKVITDKGWREDLLYHGCVIVHIFCKDKLPGYNDASPRIYRNTLLSPSGVTFLNAFMDLHLP